jgi:hypothetical protein
LLSLIVKTSTADTACLTWSENETALACDLVSDRFQTDNKPFLDFQTGLPDGEMAAPTGLLQLAMRIKEYT